ncbi:MAG: cardiolipin synthase [Planctomycetes bacterium]|nr:cardiolipin synthase [Planctomycetota bacterium]MCB9905953.1 cardiolipin synthase [Planctomycetota bacterium]
MLELALAIALAVGHLAVVIWVLLTEKRQPTATLAWLQAILFLPIVGFLLYLLIGTTKAKRIAARTTRAHDHVEALVHKYGLREQSTCETENFEPRQQALLKLGDRLASMPATHSNHAEILVDGRETYASAAASIDTATDHVHVQFYIVQPDQTGVALRDLLVRKARQGVQVRVLVDAVGSMSLPADFWKPLEDAGGLAARFNPIVRSLNRFRRHERIDFRNHRKIVVVDGRIAFTGGINVGREYLGLDPAMGNWRDTHARLTGPAVIGLQRTFAEDWYASTDELLDDVRYFPAPEPRHYGKALVQVIDSGPDRKWSPIEHIYTQAIALSEEAVWITSPYFIPSQSIESALVAAALRGVDVRVLVPEKSDSRVVTLASSSWYRDLIEAGVRIFRYQSGFVHAKTMVVDRWVGTIGSANLDTRSFDLNFELGIFLQDSEFTDQLRAQFEADLLHAREWTIEDERAVGLGLRILRALARLMSPLL